MDSERRHELQENSLSVEITQIAAWLRKHGFKVLVGLLLVILIVTFSIMYYRNKQAAAGLNAHYLTQWARGSQGIPEQARAELLSGDGHQAAMANFLAGRDALDSSNRAATPVEAMDLQDKAAGYFQTVIDRFGDQKVLVARAHRNLATIAQNKQQFEESLKHIQAIVDMDGLNAGYPIYNWALQAQRELSQLVESGQLRVAMAVQTPPRAQARTRAVQLLDMVSQEADAEQMAGFYPADSGVGEKLKDKQLTEAISRRTGIADSHVVGSEALLLSGKIAPEQGDDEPDPDAKDTALLIRMKKQGLEWMVTDIQQLPAEQAEKTFQDFLQQEA